MTREPAPSEEEVQDVVRQFLADQPRPTIPPDVFDRVMAAVSVESRARAAAGPVAPVVELAARRHRRWIIPAAAAAALILLVGIVILPSRTSPPESTTAAAPVPGAECGVAAMPSADMSPVSYNTGTTYQAANFTTQSQALLARSAACPAAVATPSEKVLAEQAAPDSAPAGHRPAVARCLVSVVPGSTILAADRAVYEGERVVVTVIQATPVRAVAIDCSPLPGRILHEAALG